MNHIFSSTVGEVGSKGTEGHPRNICMHVVGVCGNELKQLLVVSEGAV